VSRICFIDTETTSLRPDRRAWDVALIVREDGEDVEHQWYVDGEDIDLGNADPFALKIGHFYERHPNAATGERFTSGTDPERFVLQRVELLTRGGHLVGAVPNFDAEVLGTRMRTHGLLPSWHYHLVDVETLMVGWLMRKKQQLQAEEPAVDYGDFPSLPWKSEDLSRAVGVEAPSGEDRHTALGDARWCRDMFDAVMGGVAS
jgi:DNA polymerase III epsilon subunit-like protein